MKHSQEEIDRLLELLAGVEAQGREVAARSDTGAGTKDAATRLANEAAALYATLQTDAALRIVSAGDAR